MPAGNVENRCIRETQRAGILTPKGVHGLEEEIRTRYEIDLASLEQLGPHVNGDVEIAPSPEHGHDFQEHVFEEERVAPLAGDEMHHGARRSTVMPVARVVIRDHKARVENDQSRQLP